MPHSGGLSLAMLLTMVLSRLSAVSSLIRMPSPLPEIKLPERIELTVPIR